MHYLKFDSYMESFNGTYNGAVQFEKIGKIPFSYQTFNYEQDGIAMSYDLRIVQIGLDYYAFYSFDVTRKLEESKKTLDDIILSLSEENLEK